MGTDGSCSLVGLPWQTPGDHWRLDVFTDVQPVKITKEQIYPGKRTWLVERC